MQFKAILVALFATAVVAIPQGGPGSGSESSEREGSVEGGHKGGNKNPGFIITPYEPCPDGVTSNTPVCCETIVLGAAATGCYAPTETPTSGRNFRDICHRAGRTATCCTTVLATVGAVCVMPVGTQ